ncbi:MAG: 6-carboxyhexanoate--CoA ligase [Candidatus Sulfobium sp.]
MLNIRMRASRKGKGRCGGEVHISGAEGIYEDVERHGAIESYVSRALNHPRGLPDTIVVTVEKVSRKPRMVQALPVRTVKCNAPPAARKIIRRILAEAGVSGAAVRTAEKVLRTGTMRGASLVSAISGGRLEPDKVRGVRASRLGITRQAERSLSRRLVKEGIDTTTVREAIILATKVAQCRNVTAEVCISDDPDYTTGYVASRRFGYLRIPCIKSGGSRQGGRVFFVEEGSDVEKTMEFLEKFPVLISETGELMGTLSIDEIIGPDL